MVILYYRVPTELEFTATCVIVRSRGLTHSLAYERIDHVEVGFGASVLRSVLRVALRYLQGARPRCVLLYDALFFRCCSKNVGFDLRWGSIRC